MTATHPTPTLPDDPAAPAASGDMRRRALEHLAALAGPEAHLREDQWTAISALVEHRRRVVVVQRTGWGKSAVYWVATALRRAQGAGPTLVVSPLLALMRDQVAAAGRAGLAAATLNSANADDWPAIEERISADAVDVLLISPERLNSAGFRSRVLPSLAPRLGMLVVDEAHCISDWGHDFRPDYRRIASVLAGLPAGTPVLATTATANARVSADVAAQLGADTLTLRGPLDREGLALAVVPTPDALHAYAWVADHLASTAGAPAGTAAGTAAGTGIIYTLTVAQTQRLAEFLRERGHAVAAYSSATPPEERERLEAALLAGSLRALVATSSLGMGYDHPRLSFVIHVGAPSSPIAYYQQIGRAGRALASSVAVLLPTPADERIWAYFDSTAFPPQDVVRRVLAALAALPPGDAASLPRLEADTGLRRGRLEALLKVLDVDGAVQRVGSGWRSTGAPWTYDAPRIAGVAAARRAEQDVMRRYAATGGAAPEACLMQTLRAELDDPDARPCGRCSACTGQLPFPGALPNPATVLAATAHLRGCVNVLEPRKMWPSGASRRGRIPDDLRAEPGRALAVADDPAWGAAVTAALNADHVPEEILTGLVAVLARWGWPAGRPTWVTWMPSRRHDALLADLAGRLAALGRMQVHRAVVETGGTDGTGTDGTGTGETGRTGTDEPSPASTSTGAAQAALTRLTLASALTSGVTPGPTSGVSSGVPEGPVLLLDARRRSGWSSTVAAFLLRDAGTGPVYPLVLHADA